MKEIRIDEQTYKELMEIIQAIEEFKKEIEENEKNK